MPVKTKLVPRLNVDGASFRADYFESGLPERTAAEPTEEELTKEVAVIEERIRRHWDFTDAGARELAVLVHHTLTSDTEDFTQADAERYGLKEIPSTDRVCRVLAVSRKTHN